MSVEICQVNMNYIFYNKDFKLNIGNCTILLLFSSHSIENILEGTARRQKGMRLSYAQDVVP